MNESRGRQVDRGQDARRGPDGRVRVRALLATLALALASLAFAGAASAQQVQTYQYKDSFDGSGSTAGAFDDVGNLALDQQTGDVYVIDVGTKAVSRFDAAGNPAPFSNSSTPGSSIVVGGIGQNSSCCKRSYIAVDNSAGATQGRFYLLSFAGGGSQEIPRVHAYLQSGEELGGEWPLCGNRCSRPDQFIASPLGIAVGPDGTIWASVPFHGFLTGVPGRLMPFTPSGERIQEREIVIDRQPRALDLDADGNLYVQHPPREVSDNVVRKHVPDSSQPLGAALHRDLFSRAVAEYPDGSSDTDVAVDRSRGLVYVNQATRVDVYDTSGAQVGTIGEPEGSYEGLLHNSTGVAVNEATGEVYVNNDVTQTIDVFESTGMVEVPDVETLPPSEVSTTKATLRGSLDPEGGGDTTVCRFIWGLTAGMANSTPCAEGQVHPSAGGVQDVSAEIDGLLKGRQYFYRLVVGNAAGPLQYGANGQFWASGEPLMKSVAVTSVNTNTAEIGAEIDANGGNTTYRVEIGETAAYGTTLPLERTPAEEIEDCYTDILDATRTPPCTGRLRQAAGYGTVVEGYQPVEMQIPGLTPDTTYHYRIVAENHAGVTEGADRTFHTFAFVPFDDTCVNALARQQTSGAHLLDCRAYELVSAPDAGGYNVRADIGDDVPLPGFPLAPGKALYATVDGGIPGSGNPTNRGPDPYLATRGGNGWTTTYAGVPSFAPSAAPFASPLAGADGGLTTLAFAGADGCSPCFSDGDTNIPLRRADGTLVKGMSGSLDPGPSTPAGVVREHFNANRGGVHDTHFVFGTTAKFEPEGNGNGTDVTIYDRNLDSGATQVVSRLPSGEVIADGDAVAALGISDDGERLVIGHKVSTDASGNEYFQLYFHVGGSSNTVALTPGSTSGALYAGMSADGGSVFFTTPDTLTGDDADNSSDLYRADVSAASAELTRVSIGDGGTGNTDACSPEANSANRHWNSVDGSADCDAVALGGGAGVGAETGSVYFLSPEQLDGSEGNAGEPNLYLAEIGDAPRFVTTLESGATGPSPLATDHPFEESFGSFSNPGSVAVHEASDSIYVIEVNTGSIKKFDADGDPSDFSALGSNTISGNTFRTSFAQIAVDNSGGMNDGNIYVNSNDFGNPVVLVYDASGTPVGELTGSTTPQGSFGGFASGVAVDPNGAVYVGGRVGGFGSGQLHRYVPSGDPVADSDYDATMNLTFSPTAFAVDSSGNAYAQSHNGFFLEPGIVKLPASQFGAGTASVEPINATSKAAAVNPVNDHLFASSGTEVVEYRADGLEHGRFGLGDITNGLGLAVSGDSSRIYVSDATEGHMSIFGTVLGPDRRVDSPVVVGAVNDSEKRVPATFQANASGSVAAFAATVPLTGFETRGTVQVYRYAADSDNLACISCAPSEQPSGGNAGLATNGNSITADGRVFFNSPDRLVLTDGNGQMDAYEWSDAAGPHGRAELISTGLSEAPSTILSVSAEGTDALFFTRQKLSPQDLNGATVKLYTARVEGGFFQLPPSQPCKASDECRGAGTKAAAPPPIATLKGSEAQVKPEAGKAKCNARKHARNARRASRKAKAMRRRARSLSGWAASRFKKKAHRAARSAKRAGKAAKKCRRAAKGQARNKRRAGK